MHINSLLCLIMLSVCAVKTCAKDDVITPETKAIIKTATGFLKDKKAEDRIKGADMLGELGIKAMSARRDLCAAILDKNAKVQAAAADALKKVDEKTAEIAMKIYINADFDAITKLLGQGAKAEPLTPIVLAYSIQMAEKNKLNKRNEFGEHVVRCIQVLAAIAPSDEQANKYIISGLSSIYPRIRMAAAAACGTITYGKTALPQVADIAKRGTGEERLAAIDTLVLIADETTKKDIEKVLNAMRFDKEETIRKAVQSGLDKLNMKEKIK